jgi:hypothetical protein
LIELKMHDISYENKLWHAVYLNHELFIKYKELLKERLNDINTTGYEFCTGMD